MKISHKIKTLLIITLILSHVSGISQKKNDFIILSGVITNKTDDEIKLYNTQNKLVSEMSVSSEGKFTETLKLKEGLYTILYNRFQTNIYLQSQANLKIAFDTKNFNESLKFTGDGEVINEYLKDKRRITSEITGNFMDFYKLDDPATFKSKSELINQKLSELLNSKNTVSAIFKTREESNLYYEALARLIQYNRTKSEVFDLKQDIDKIDVNNVSEADFDFSGAYQTFLKYYLSKLSEEIAAKDKISQDIAYLNALSKIKSQYIKNQFLYDTAKQGINFTNHLEGYYNAFMSGSSDLENNKSITDIYNKLNKLKPGTMSPNFTDYVNYNGGKSSLSDFKGKYLYIDIWATWCQPCRKEIPFLKKLEHDYKDKNIEFISISIDKVSDLDKWKNLIKEKELGGTQLLANADWKSQFIVDYYVSGIPRFILLNPKGEIISSNAPRPSSEEIVTLLNSLSL